MQFQNGMKRSHWEKEPGHGWDLWLHYNPLDDSQHRYWVLYCNFHYDTPHSHWQCRHALRLKHSNRCD